MIPKGYKRVSKKEYKKIKKQRERTNDKVVFDILIPLLLGLLFFILSKM